MTALALSRARPIRWRRSGQLTIVTSERHDEASLAAAVSARDESALEIVYREYGGAVRAVASMVLRDESLAEDVVEEVFVSFWKDPSKFDVSRVSLRTFLLTIAHRRAVDIIRSEEGRSLREDTSIPAAEEGVWIRTQSEAVRRAVAGLSEPERQAISLAYFSGLTHVEVAKRLEQPEGAVTSRIRSGMMKLSEIPPEVAS